MRAPVQTPAASLAVEPHRESNILLVRRSSRPWRDRPAPGVWDREGGEGGGGGTDIVCSSGAGVRCPPLALGVHEGGGVILNATLVRLCRELETRSGNIQARAYTTPPSVATEASGWTRGVSAGSAGSAGSAPDQTGCGCGPGCGCGQRSPAGSRPSPNSIAHLIPPYNAPQ
jgi:hypothetical protein